MLLAAWSGHSIVQGVVAERTARRSRTLSICYGGSIAKWLTVSATAGAPSIGRKLTISYTVHHYSRPSVAAYGHYLHDRLSHYHFHYQQQQHQHPSRDASLCYFSRFATQCYFNRPALSFSFVTTTAYIWQSRIDAPPCGCDVMVGYPSVCLSVPSICTLHWGVWVSSQSTSCQCNRFARTR